MPLVLLRLSRIYPQRAHGPAQRRLLFRRLSLGLACLLIFFWVFRNTPGTRSFLSLALVV